MKNRTTLRAHILSFIVISLTAVSTIGQDHGNVHTWTYSGEHGPLHWGDLGSEFATCTSGKTQSPIDITSPRHEQLPSLSLSYHASALKIIDNGHTVQVNYAPGSSLRIGSDSYELIQIHFHHPGENRINGKAYPMEAHFVHKNQQGRLAVVAVMITEGAANPLINVLWKNLPSEKGKEQTSDQVTINAAELLPSSRHYYTFMGSLTTPPCTEGVVWYVLKTPVSLSQDQVNQFAEKYPLNARPVQSSNNRVVRESF